MDNVSLRCVVYIVSRGDLKLAELFINTKLAYLYVSIPGLTFVCLFSWRWSFPCSCKWPDVKKQLIAKVVTSYVTRRLMSSRLLHSTSVLRQFTENLEIVTTAPMSFCEKKVTFKTTPSHSRDSVNIVSFACPYFVWKARIY